jgi:hypothetical protein
LQNQKIKNTESYIHKDTYLNLVSKITLIRQINSCW